MRTNQQVESRIRVSRTGTESLAMLKKIDRVEAQWKAGLISNDEAFDAL